MELALFRPRPPDSVTGPGSDGTFGRFRVLPTRERLGWAAAGSWRRATGSGLSGKAGGVDHKNGWLRLLETNPDHSLWYINRFRSMADAGTDLAGEARFVDAMARRRARILDAGCGTGRVGGRLAASDHDVVGVDLDPVLIDAARRAYPRPTWLLGDLAELDLPSAGIVEGFDVVVCAGNVMTFLAPDTRVEVLRRMGAHLREGGRLVVGFGAGRGYDFAEFLDDAGVSGLLPDLLLSTWDLRPFGRASDFLVAVLRAVQGPETG